MLALRLLPIITCIPGLETIHPNWIRAGFSAPVWNILLSVASPSAHCNLIKTRHHKNYWFLFTGLRGGEYILNSSTTAGFTELCVSVWGGGWEGAHNPCNRCQVELLPLPVCTLRNVRLIPGADPTCMCACRVIYHILDLEGLWEALFGSSGVQTPPPPPPFMLIPAWSLLRRLEGEGERALMDQLTVACCCCSASTRIRTDATCRWNIRRRRRARIM